MATVSDLSYEIFGVRPQPAVPRFDQDGWTDEESPDSQCPICHGELHAMGKQHTNNEELQRRGLSTFEFEGRTMSRLPYIKIE